jgi:hypothetical protein
MRYKWIRKNIAMPSEKRNLTRIWIPTNIATMQWKIKGQIDVQPIQIDNVSWVPCRYHQYEGLIVRANGEMSDHSPMIIENMRLWGLVPFGREWKQKEAIVHWRDPDKIVPFWIRCGLQWITIGWPDSQMEMATYSHNTHLTPER